MFFENYTESNTMERGLSFISAIIGTGAIVGVVGLIHDQPEILTFNAAQSTLGSEENHWSLPQVYLLSALPLGAMMVVFVRSMLGWKTFGLFTPMLLAMAFLQSGPVLGPAISIFAVLVGMLCAPLLKWLQLSRVAFLGVLIGIVVTCLGSAAQHMQESMIANAFPVVVTALIVERWWTSWETQGPRQALKETSMTLFVAIAIQFVIAAPILVEFGTTHPMTFTLGATIATVFLGRYKGLRLTEIARFRLARDN